MSRPKPTPNQRMYPTSSCVSIQNWLELCCPKTPKNRSATCSFITSYEYELHNLCVFEILSLEFVQSVILMVCPGHTASFREGDHSPLCGAMSQRPIEQQKKGQYFVNAEVTDCLSE